LRKVQSFYIPWVELQHSGGEGSEGKPNHDLFMRLSRNKDGKRDEAIGPPSDSKERQSFLKWG